MQTHKHNHSRLPPQAVTSCTFPEATVWLKALCHFHHDRVSIRTTNFSLQLLLLLAEAFIFQSQAWIFQDWVTDPVKNETRDGAGGGCRGRSREVWVITLGFADLINDLSPTDFNQTTLVQIIFIDFHLSSDSLYYLINLKWPVGPTWLCSICKTYNLCLNILLSHCSANWDQQTAIMWICLLLTV